jgi:alkylation response protein AidB-like acyl-CoA dehydrogenase
MTEAAVVDLEELLGDPTNEGSLLSYAAIVNADRDRELVPEAEAALTDWGFGEEFVPRSLGGRWVSSEDLVRRLLPVFRRDPALGLGQGVTSLMAAVNIWTGGDDGSKARVSAALKRGERIAVGFHELAHGNDLMSNECRATWQTDAVAGWKIDGRKEVINNVDRAESVLLFARTGHAPDARGFSLFLWSKGSATAGSVDFTRRLLTAGMRGCQIGAITLDGLVIPQDSLVGRVGTAVPTALRAFQITRSVLPAIANGTLDAAIRLGLAYMRRRRLYGGTVWDLPHARSLLTRAWAALLVSDALARASVRVLHLRPDEAFLASASTKYLASTLINAAMDHLSVLLGSSFYAIGDRYGVFEKWLRDMALLPIGHAGSAACLLSIVPNIPTWARRSRRSSTYEPGIFSNRCRLGELDFTSLGLGTGRQDSLTSPLTSPDVRATIAKEHPQVLPLVDLWRQELTDVISAAAVTKPTELGAEVTPRAMGLARRIATLMAAGAVLGSWHEGREDPRSPFSTGPHALHVALLQVTELLEHVPIDGVGTDAAGRPASWPQQPCDAAAREVATVADTGLSLGVEHLPIRWNQSNGNSQTHEARSE